MASGRTADVPSWPTAHTSSARAAVTAVNNDGTPAPAGTATRLHCAPFQCSINDCRLPACPAYPTAHTSFDDVPDTPSSTASPLIGTVGTTLHDVPFQCSASGMCVKLASP